MLSDHEVLRQEYNAIVFLDVWCCDHASVIFREVFHSDVIGQCSLHKALLFKLLILFAIKMTFRYNSKFIFNFFNLRLKALYLFITRIFFQHFRCFIRLSCKNISFSKSKCCFNKSWLNLYTFFAILYTFFKLFNLHISISSIWIVHMITLIQLNSLSIHFYRLIILLTKECFVAFFL